MNGCGHCERASAQRLVGVKGEEERKRKRGNAFRATWGWAGCAGGLLQELMMLQRRKFV
jgi:hypothetical protein